MTAAVGDRAQSLIWRFRLATCVLVLTAVSFTQRPGRLVSDTKLDLVVDPGGFLGRALHLWEPLNGFGQVQNQAYGYLFPLGPFFWIGDLLTLPGWVVQRLWWSLLLSVAFLGVVKLCAVLGIGTPTGRIVAGFAYALSPRILTTLGPISIEAWPSALTPWVLVPLVIGTTRGSPRRAAALSALAVAAVGGVNAVATFAVIPLGALWLLTREPGRRRRALMLWWPLFVLAGTAWWLVPLLLLGRYSPPFLDYIETASVTTFPATLFDALRGTSHWVPYVDGTWQAGNDLLTTPYLILNSGVLLFFGVVGLASHRNPHRLFLGAGVVVGLLAVTLGHTQGVHGWLGPDVQELLDGPLAPLRNVHKFDPLIRLPLVLGLAHALQLLPGAVGRLVDGRPRPVASGESFAFRAVLVVVAVAVVGTASPAFSGRLAPANAFTTVPDYWSEAADWLHENAERDTTLLAPGSSFGTYVWGDPDDEPLQPLARSPWAVRNAVPLAPPGNIRMLDAVEERLDAGQPSAGLAAFLRRAGVGHVVLRTDLRATPDQPEPALVRRALAGSPGITRVATFGPVTTGGAVDELDDARLVVRDGWQERSRALEVYEVEGAEQAVAVAAPPVVVGGPEDLLDLADAGIVGDEPTLLAADTAERPAGSPLVLTDGLRRREVNFARLRDGRSATLAADDDGRLGAPAREYALPDSDRWQTTARLFGAAAVTASSSQAYADASVTVRPETVPTAALDGRERTSWVPDPTDGQPWVQVDLEQPADLDEVTVVLAPGTTPSSAKRIGLRLETDRGTGAWVRAADGATVVLPVPAGETRRLRLTLEPVFGAEPPAVAEIRVPGLQVRRSLVLPEVPRSWGAPDTILLSGAEDRRSACLEVDGDVRCGAGRERPGEEPLTIDRVVRLGEGASYQVGITAEPVDSDALQGLLQRNQLANVRASSSAVPEAAASAVAAADGRIGTTWTADPDDPGPTLTVTWVGKRRIAGLDLALDRQAPAAAVTRVLVRYDGGSQAVRVDRRGHADLTPFRADRVEIEVLADDGSLRLLPDGSTEELGAGVSELRLDGVPMLPLRLSDVPTDIGCGFGPTLRIGEQIYATSITASPQQLLAGGALPGRVCGPDEIEVPSGETRVILGDAPAFRGDHVRLTRVGAEPAAGAIPATVDAPDPVTRDVDLAAAGGAAGYVALDESTNPGWVADGLEAVTLDGWRQGWRYPAGTDRVQARYAPDTTYRLALLGGGALLVLLALGTLLSRRRTTPASAWPAVAARAVPRWWVVGAGAGALVLLAGWWGVLAAALTVLVSLVPARVPGDALAWAAGVPVAAGALLYWARPLGTEAGWAGNLAAPQVLVLVTLAMVLARRATPAGRAAADP